MTAHTTPTIAHHIDLTAFNTLGFSVSAEQYIAVRDTPSFIQWWCAPEQAALREQPRFILGGGSNLVLTQDIQALVLHLQTFQLKQQVKLVQPTFQQLKEILEEILMQLM